MEIKNVRTRLRIKNPGKCKIAQISRRQERKQLKNFSEFIMIAMTATGPENQHWHNIAHAFQPFLFYLNKFNHLKSPSRGDLATVDIESMSHTLKALSLISKSSFICSVTLLSNKQLSSSK